MTPQQRINLRRLLSPRHIAFVGGSSAELAAQQCIDAGFLGQIWGVNPHRADMAGRPCVACVDALPEPPDAVFLAAPREAIVETVSALAKHGAGGAVCYTAGFRETGADGAFIERALVDASGDLALVGPNCLGLLNYVNDAILWPFGHGGTHVSRGVAIVSQSGLLCTNLTMTQRSVPFSYVISVGNQSVVGIEDLIDVLLEEPAVSAIGIYAEGLRNISGFSTAAARALEHGIPLVMLKAGRSETGAMLAVTHTGSLAGTDRLYDTLFERLAVLRVQSPAELLEMLKLLHCTGAPKGNRVAAFTCSGGDAALLADLGEAKGLAFPQPPAGEAKRLRKLLPPIATVSNPLDYTTPLWGKGKALEQVFDAVVGSGFDAAVIVQDYMSPKFATDNESYLSDTRAFVAATHRAGIPAAVVSSMPENLPEAARTLCLEAGVAPLQGIETAVVALAGVVAFGAKRARVLETGTLAGLDLLPPVPIDILSAEILDEWQGKRLLAAAGIAVPAGMVANAATAPDVARSLGFPVVVKLLSCDLPHKTEVGAVRLGLNSVEAVAAAVGEIASSVARHAPDIAVERFLVECMIERPVAELFVGVRFDPTFGQFLVLGAGGTFVEVMRDTAMLILPTDTESIEHTLRSLRIAPILVGYRGSKPIEFGRLVDTIATVATFAQQHLRRLVELDVNPLMALPDRVIAADVLLRMVPPSGHLSARSVPTTAERSQRAAMPGE